MSFFFAVGVFPSLRIRFDVRRLDLFAAIFAVLCIVAGIQTGREALLAAVTAVVCGIAFAASAARLAILRPIAN